MAHFSYDIDPAYWIVRYQDIARTLGLDPDRDREATATLHGLLSDHADSVSRALRSAEQLIRGRTVVVFGCAPSLDANVRRARATLLITDAPKMAADGATSALLEAGIRPEIVVTDLDGRIPDIIAASGRGAIIMLHAHGDNIARVRGVLPRLRNVLPITQTEPTSIVRNFGGFTDGDKCAYIASSLGATRIVLFGMEFGTQVGRRSDPSHRKQDEHDRKLLKLMIGRALTEELIKSSRIPCCSMPPSPFPFVEEIDCEALSALLRGVSR